MMLARRSARMLRRGAALPAARAHASVMDVSAVGSTRRSFLTDRAASIYWMKRAKILQIVWRMIVAYPQMHDINVPTAEINKLFAHGMSERERAFAFVLSQVPPDEPIDLREFLRGAEDAAQQVYQAIYADGDTATRVLETLATKECVDMWKAKVERQRRVLKLAADARLVLDCIEVQHVGVAEVNYTYGDAKDEVPEAEMTPPADKDAASGSAASAESESTPHKEGTIKDSAVPLIRPHSKFLLHEAIQLKAQFNIREHLTVNGSQPVTFDTRFEWAFDSDVSRADLVDWVITDTTPFESNLVADQDTAATSGNK